MSYRRGLRVNAIRLSAILRVMLYEKCLEMDCGRDEMGAARRSCFQWMDTERLQGVLVMSHPLFSWSWQHARYNMSLRRRSNLSGVPSRTVICVGLARRQYFFHTKPNARLNCTVSRHRSLGSTTVSAVINDKGRKVR